MCARGLVNGGQKNTQVSLAEELPSLKALIRAQRERAIAAGIDPDAIDIMEDGGAAGSAIACWPPPSVNLDASVNITRHLPLISPRQ